MLLSVVCCSSFAVCRLLIAICCVFVLFVVSVFVVRFSWVVASCLMFVVRSLLRVGFVCCLLVVFCGVWFVLVFVVCLLSVVLLVVCCLAFCISCFGVCCMLFVGCWLSTVWR